MNPTEMSQKTFKREVLRQRDIKRKRIMKMKNRKSDIEDDVDDVVDEVADVQDAAEEPQENWLNDLLGSNKSSAKEDTATSSCSTSSSLTQKTDSTQEPEKLTYGVQSVSSFVRFLCHNAEMLTIVVGTVFAAYVIKHVFSAA